MSLLSVSEPAVRRARHRLFLVAGILAAELALLALAYQMLVSVECSATSAEFACRGLRGMVARAMAVCAAFAVYLWARPTSRARLGGEIAEAGGGAGWAALHLVGLAMILAPLALGGALADRFTAALGPMAIGAVATTLGAVFWLAPPAGWLRWLRGERFAPLAILALAALLPDLADLSLPLWDRPELTRATFLAVADVLWVAGAAPYVDPGSYVIGVEGFLVHIARQCSGVEGFALVTGFALLYAWLFREETRLTRFWLVLFPLALICSWIFNVLRIAGLIALGAHVSPELATNGFHSYAGWILFTLLALGLIAAARALPWVAADLPSHPRRDTPEPSLEPRLDAARILPFAALMLGGAILPALATVPELVYPVKIAVVVPVLWIFRRSYRRLIAPPDAVAILAGALVGVLWLATQPAAQARDAALAEALGGLGGLALGVWIVLRVAGTALVVPLVEELFFRGYLLARIGRGSPGGRWIGLAVSTGLFAAMHGRWVVAGVSGLVFGLAMLRRGRLADAVQAHLVANLVIAVWAALRGDWGAI